MKNFLFQGREYKVINGLVHRTDNSGDFTIADPCYQGDNVLLDAYAEYLGVKMYQRPQGVHAYGHQKGEARKPRHA